MKRLITLITALIITSSTIAAGQVYDRSGNQSNQKNEIRKDVKQLQRFEQKLDKFSYAMLVGDVRTARYLKQEILDDMAREVTENRRYKLRDRMDVNGYSKRRADSGTIYSKRNGVENSRYSYSHNKLYNLQTELYYEFKNLRLAHGRRGVTNENRHRAIMYEFRDTMKKEIRQERGDYRRNKRGKNW